MLNPAHLLATDWSKTSGWFKTQKDIDEGMSVYTRTMATINFGGQIFNFVNNGSAGLAGQIQMRTLTNSGGGNINWSFNQKTDMQMGISNLTGLGAYNWQPAPVVFNDILYLFVGDKSGGISYSAYNAGAKSWSSLTQVNIGTEKLGCGMAAVVLNDKLCLVFQNYTAFIDICWTTDLNNWKIARTGTVGRNKTNGTCDVQYSQISAISKTYIKNGKFKSKLVYAYIAQNLHPNLSTCIIDTLNNYQWLSNDIISNERNYVSVAIAEGTVPGDLASTGKCLQAFLKLDNKDNGYIQYRIQRFQLKEGGLWTKQEDNLVSQLKTYGTLWASHDVNLTALNFGIPDGNDIKQFMCLFYRGYDNLDYPLNCAWVETDKLIYNPAKGMTDTIGGVANSLYIGYIEGPPPFYLNDSTLTDPYINPEKNNISKVEFGNSSTTSTEIEVALDVTGSISFKNDYVKASLKTSLETINSLNITKTLTQDFSHHAKKDTKGYYIRQIPTVTRAFYYIYGTNEPSTIIDSMYYFYMSEPLIDQEEVNLKTGLIPSNPKTYMNRNLGSYNNFGTNSTSWVDAEAGNTITIAQTENHTQTVSATLSIEAGLGEMFDVGVEGTIKMSISSTLEKEFKVKSTTGLNEPVRATDVKKLNYSTYWLKRTPGAQNWWLHAGALDQGTWCVTYQVSKVLYNNGTTFEMGMADEPLSSKGFSLSQNSPNPFSSTTKFKYRIGNENPDSDGKVKLVVYNISGQEVATLVNEFKAPGSYEVEWNRSKLVPGVYFYSLQSGSFKNVKKMILL